MPKTFPLSFPQATGPNYTGLVQFLFKPFLEYPTELSVDCEQFNNGQRIWLRLAFNDLDKGRVYGRGGRNLQAIKTVLDTAAMTAGQTLNLEIYGTQSSTPSYGRESDFAPLPRPMRREYPSRDFNPRDREFNPRDEFERRENQFDRNDRFEQPEYGVDRDRDFPGRFSENRDFSGNFEDRRRRTRRFTPRPPKFRG